MSYSPIIVQGDALDFASGLVSESVDLVYVDPPFGTGKDRGSYDDKKNGSDWQDWFNPILVQLHRSLKPSGNLIVHLDFREVHYTKVFLDQLFGRDHFGNEVIWCYNSGGASKTHLSRKHDNLLWYRKGSESEATYNILREPYATPNVSDRPGFHSEGRMMNDWWQIPFLSTTALERTGYATQKPLALMERVLSIWSNPGDVVVDTFLGSGTTAVAAKNLGRAFYGCDENLESIETTRKRLQGPE